MARDLNRWTGIGRLGKDPDIRYTPNGDAVCNFSIACSETWTKDGEKHESTEWVSLVAFRKLAEVCGEYLKKGSRVYVEGKFTTRKWQDKEGKDRYSTEIRLDNMQMLDGKPAGGPRSEPDGGGRQQQDRQPIVHDPVDAPFDDSEIPF